MGNRSKAIAGAATASARVASRRSTRLRHPFSDD
jgi:hypothetical protein